MAFKNLIRKLKQKKEQLFGEPQFISNPVVDLDIDGENLIVYISKEIIAENLVLIIKNRFNENFIEKDVEVGKVIFSVDELLNLGSFGSLDLYFKLSSQLIRIKQGSAGHVYSRFKEKNCVLKSYSTPYNNLSLKFEKINLIIIESIENVGDDIIISGDFNDVIDENAGSFLEIKNRRTGKRLSEKIKSNQVIFSLSELFSLDESPFFDLYFKSINNSKVFRKRIDYDSKFQFFKGISKNKVLKIVSTKKNNLSFKQEKRYFNCSISNLDIEGLNKLFIEGELTVLDEEINHITNMEIISKSRSDDKINIFKVNFKQNGEKYIFESIIDETNHDDEKISSLRIDFYLRVYDNDIYYQNTIDLTDYASFENNEDKFLLKFDFKDNVYSYYATENNHFLALWITTESSWLKSYEITKGKTIYDKACIDYELNDKMIFFESFFGKSYSGNPKYIYEKMLEMGFDKEFTFIWAYSGDNKEIIPGNPIIVDRYKAGNYYKYLAQSKYWVNNIIFPIHKKRKGNVYLQTWHGTPLKKLGFDITIPGPEVDARRNFYNESRNWDYLISSNEYSSEIFKRAFKFKKKLLEFGYPINDIFFRDNTVFIENLREKLKIDNNKKIILYAPTWKDDEQSENWQHYFNLKIDLERLYNHFGDKYILLLKMHHLISQNLNIDDKFKDFVIDVSTYGDIQELYVLSDILITDYSSVFFDYAHSKRPILFFTPDLNHYINNVRGLYLNMKEDLPGPIINNNDDLIECIKDIEKIKKDYENKYESFYNKFCLLCDGKSSEKVVNEIFFQKIND